MIDLERLTPDQILIGVTCAVGAIVALFVLLKSFRKALRAFSTLFARKHRAADVPAPAEIDLEEIAPSGPPPTGPSLHAYNVPMRLVVLVLAPVGRGSQLPSAERLPEIVDQFAPGLFAIAQAHQARIKIWPPQLSTQGFAAALFANLPLPGHRGKGTPWCALAGRFSAGDQAFLAGLVLRAAAPNSLGQITLAHEAEWLGVLRTSHV